MAKPNSLYWLTMITGDFGSWKTFWLGAELYDLKNVQILICLIANVPGELLIFIIILLKILKNYWLFIDFYAETNLILKNMINIGKILYL